MNYYTNLEQTKPILILVQESSGVAIQVLALVPSVFP